jgi:membrane protease YdiL (CAAX protease family)
MPANRFIEFLNRGRYTEVILVLLCVFAGGPFFGVIVYILMLAGYSSFASIGLQGGQRWFTIVGLSLVIAIGIQFISKLVVNPLLVLILGPSTNTFYEAAGESLWGYLSWIGIGVLFSGFFEEFAYRGIVLNYLIRVLGTFRYGAATSLLVTSIAFGLGHYFSQGARGILPATILGLLFGATYLLFNRNLWIAIFTHGWFNFISFTLDYVRSLNQPS